MYVWIILSWLFGLASPNPDAVDTISLKHIANLSYEASNADLSSVASIFSPRMDFDQWKPLTGRGDPLRNDPTYDYEPPVLERVHYWADDTRLEREHYPERKSEVLMLGVSSRRPSVAPRQPPPRRHQRLPVPPKYEDYSYKLNEHYPMTILVPPPPPPPGHQPSPYVLTEKVPVSNPPVKITTPTTFSSKKPTTPISKSPTSLYALQESNLIYQSSTTTHNWLLNQNNSISNVVSSDYAGWGPTASIEEIEVANDTQNIIPTDHNEIFKQPYAFYKPMLSEGPPPPQTTSNSLLLPDFIPTALPPIATPQISTFSVTLATPTTDTTTAEVPTRVAQDYFEETTTERQIDPLTKLTSSATFASSKPDKNIFDMLGPMLSMPLVNGPERPEDNLYAHASENLQVYKEHPTEDTLNLETMQTMQPPPVPITESTTQSESYYTNPYIINNQMKHKPSTFTHDPYLHMRFTTVKPPNKIEAHKDLKPTSEEPPVPMYLIIQGHSKVKTYSSKPNSKDNLDTISNEIPKPNETNEVKHLHPLQDSKPEKLMKPITRESRSKNLKSLVESSFGSIEIQEADVGIKYDVSDGSDVPVEIYRKGIVDSDENSYTSKKLLKQSRQKRQIDLEDLIPFDEDTIEEYVYNFLNGKRNSTGITGLIAQAVTSDVASVVDDLEEDEDNEQEEER
ncbi:uncharacterized protein LOC135072550 [Ostrinia nubilalis]|uniref:uncharacterized protein LOC135072550 n=1 Tax=Ostrinia nubilalis TaxID=29057 RepID=UPI0030823DEE